jgi:hypothetical protein
MWMDAVLWNILGHEEEAGRIRRWNSGEVVIHWRPVLVTVAGWASLVIAVAGN